MHDQTHHLILYDGTCGLCSRFNQLILRWDGRRIFEFEPLQNPTARELLARYGRNSEDLDTFYVVAHPGAPEEFLLWKSAAVYFVIVNVFGFGRMGSRPGFFPNRLCDRVYDWIAARRYRFFGRSEKCLIPK